MNLKGCGGFKYIVAIIITGQVLIVEVMYDFFNIMPLKWQDWVIIVSLSSLVMWVRELRQIVKKKMQTSNAQRP